MHSKKPIIIIFPYNVAKNFILIVDNVLGLF